MGRIVVQPDVCNGRPVIEGTRIAAHTVLDFLAAGDSREEILRAYPSLRDEDIDACLAFASRLLESRYTLEPAS